MFERGLLTRKFVRVWHSTRQMPSHLLCLSAPAQARKLQQDAARFRFFLTKCFVIFHDYLATAYFLCIQVAGDTHWPGAQHFSTTSACVVMGVTGRACAATARLSRCSGRRYSIWTLSSHSCWDCTRYSRHDRPHRSKRTFDGVRQRHALQHRTSLALLYCALTFSRTLTLSTLYNLVARALIAQVGL